MNQSPLNLTNFRRKSIMGAQVVVSQAFAHAEGVPVLPPLAGFLGNHAPLQVGTDGVAYILKGNYCVPQFG